MKDFEFLSVEKKHTVGNSSVGRLDVREKSTAAGTAIMDFTTSCDHTLKSTAFGEVEETDPLQAITEDLKAEEEEKIE